MTIMERYGTVLRCWKSRRADEVADPYTIVPPRWDKDYVEPYRNSGLWPCARVGESPFHPQGFGQRGTCAIGSHLGKRVRWDELPPDVQKFARQSFPEYAPKE